MAPHDGKHTSVHNTFRTWLRQNRLLILLFLVILGFSSAVLIHLEGSDAPLLVFLAALIFIPALLILYAVSEALWHKQRWPQAKTLSRSCIALMLFIAAELIVTALITTLDPNSPHRQMANCEQLVPHLENYFTAHSQYPATLGDLEQFSELPEHIDTSACEYLGQARDFSLTTNRTDTHYYLYDHKAGKWLFLD